MESPLRQQRTAELKRGTHETRVHVSLNLDGEGKYRHQTGIGFLDHMLDLFAKHGQFDINVICEGDLEVDDHHTVEDIGISLGSAFKEALGDKAHINRYGHAYVPMDDALVRSVVDLSGRFYLHFDASFNRTVVGSFSTEMVSHFWYSFAEKLSMNLHITLLHGTNTHHAIEAIFKATAKALRTAITRSALNPHTPSTKGTI